MLVSGGLRVATDLHNSAAPGANTNILSTAYTPKEGGALRIFVVLATASVFNVMITRSGTTFTVNLNSGVALQAGVGYTFVIGCSTSSTYNYQVATDGVIRILQVDEISWGVI